MCNVYVFKLLDIVVRRFRKREQNINKMYVDRPSYAYVFIRYTYYYTYPQYYRNRVEFLSSLRVLDTCKKFRTTSKQRRNAHNRKHFTLFQTWLYYSCSLTDLFQKFSRQTFRFVGICVFVFFVMITVSCIVYLRVVLSIM